MTFYLFVFQTASKSFLGLNLKKVQLVPKIYSHPDERLLELELTNNLPLPLLMEKTFFWETAGVDWKRAVLDAKKLI